ncbi:peptidase inhibitor family I36 protein [Streptomyces sp. NPDC092952]|uniref:peptidase inhibitor family I36 protein n=1 Tax=Streptomyces sp. NPDC092952 TaxID=3366018 RepID=UPI00382F0CD4
MCTTRKFAAVAGGIALTGGLLAGGAGAAGAAEVAPTAASDCGEGWYCVWTGENYTGTKAQIAGNNADLTVYPIFQKFKSRYQHGRNCDFKWFSEKNYKGNSGVIKRGSKLTGPEIRTIKSNKWVNCV